MDRQYRLPKEFATKWLAALRSGEYKQGRGRLVGENGYCCIGVGGKVCGLSDNDMNNCGLILSRIIPTTHSIPTEIRGSTHLTEHIVCLNDSEGKTFTEIADWIEQNVELY